MIQEISDISQRANINFRKTDISNAVIYEDHRTILNVIYFVKSIRDISNPIDLILFDRHDDFNTPNNLAFKKALNFIKKPTIEKLHQIVEFELSTNDDDWVKMGMELGLIGNVFLFNSESTIENKKVYKTKKFGTKTLYNLGNIWSVIGDHKGLFNDISQKHNYQLWNEFGWRLENGKFSFDKNRSEYIVDIDLDCFSIDILDSTMAIPENLLIKKRECKLNFV